MTNKNTKKSKLPLIVGITGAAVAAGAAVAGVLTFKDKKNRDKVKKVAGEVKELAHDYIQKAKKDIKNLAGEVIDKKPVIQKKSFKAK